MFNSTPSTDNVSQAQIKAGYNPGGYGGPDHIKIDEVDIADGQLGTVFVARWSCCANCD